MKTGAGTLLLDGGQTNSGGVTVNNGTLITVMGVTQGDIAVEEVRTSYDTNLDEVDVVLTGMTGPIAGSAIVAIEGTWTAVNGTFDLASRNWEYQTASEFGQGAGSAPSTVNLPSILTSGAPWGCSGGSASNWFEGLWYGFKNQGISIPANPDLATMFVGKGTSNVSFIGAMGFTANYGMTELVTFANNQQVQSGDGLVAGPMTAGTNGAGHATNKGGAAATAPGGAGLREEPALAGVGADGHGGQRGAASSAHAPRLALPTGAAGRAPVLAVADLATRENAALPTDSRRRRPLAGRMRPRVALRGWPMRPQSRLAW